METLGLALRAYAGRRVLITGHTGFKGGWLALWLERYGAILAGVSLPPETAPSLFAGARLGEVLTHREADIRDADCLAELVREFRPEIVFHLAAQALVRRGYREPLATLASNVMGTANLLEAVRGCDAVRAVVVATSDKCYENDNAAPAFVERDRLGGHDPYSASKACAEIVTAAWRDAFMRGNGSPLLATVRAGNVIGGGDWAEDRLVPDLVRAAAAGREAPIRNPAAIRPWQHVLEPLAGYLMLGQRLLAGERGMAGAWNFGPEAEDMQPVFALCDAVCPRLGGGWRHDAGEQPAEAVVLRLDSAKARRELGWRPRWRLAETLRHVADWYARFDRGHDARELCLEQIALYEKEKE